MSLATSPVTMTPATGGPFLPAEQLAVAGRAWYADTYARLAAHNRYLRLTVLALAITEVALVLALVRTVDHLRHQRPWVVRINDVGRAEAVRYDAAHYTPREPELRFFLHEFIVSYFSRLRANKGRDYTNSLLFLESTLAQATLSAQRKTRELETFLAGTDPEVEIQVRTVAFLEIRTPPYRATADYERVYLHAHTRQEIKRERYTGTFDFVLAPTVTDALVLVNPLGLVITYFREDRELNPPV